jgi:hypothetical protein
MSNGGGLWREFPSSKVTELGAKLPSEYGGSGASLESNGNGPLLEEVKAKE